MAVNNSSSIPEYVLANIQVRWGRILLIEWVTTQRLAPLNAWQIVYYCCRRRRLQIDQYNSYLNESFCTARKATQEATV
jgi:hypothetical protein